MRNIDLSQVDKQNNLLPCKALPVFAHLSAAEQARIINAMVNQPETVAVLSTCDGTISHWKSKQDDVIDPYGCYCVWPQVTEGNPQ